jgi:quercetin dioxygenase-like cupin family protein
MPSSGLTGVFLGGPHRSNVIVANCDSDSMIQNHAWALSSVARRISNEDPDIYYRNAKGFTVDHTWLAGKHQWWRRKVTVNNAKQSDGSAISNVWSDFVPDSGSPGFSLRTTYPANPEGVEVMLERWEAGTAEPPHSHPGDDMTIVVEGKMSTQRYRREGASLVADGERIILNKGDVGYTTAGRIHDAKYIDDCQLVYVHDGAFGFIPADPEIG